MSKSPTIKELLINLTSHVYKLEANLEVIDIRTVSYPKLYDNVDKLVGEIVENRQERVFIAHKLQDHERRLIKLEKHL